ncbi:hypothetical protein FMM05_06630 [Flavobacterium zepuense]|uniref:histidine kinase n=1 Tax=Flavobacterium zepuense TaxID=2593302 RepID=A0A552V5Z5_9FLAO|nr:sensor histidine kinase [Flavobacterium zepuense]TRW25893.1 hypothetical protein FMM05_06630 [Flavobacterium zepuense]
MNTKAYICTVFYANLLGVLLLLCTMQSLAQTQDQDNTQDLTILSKAPELAAMQQQVKLYEQAKDWPNTIDALRSIAMYYIHIRDFSPALPYLQKALTLANNHARQKSPEVLSDISYFYGYNEDYVNSLNYAIKALKLAENMHLNNAVMCTVYQKAAMAYSSASQYNNAVTYSKKAVQFAEKTQDKNLIVHGYFTLVENLAQVHHDAEAINRLKELEQKYPSSDPEFNFDLNYYFTNIYIRANNKEKARFYFKRLLAIDRTVSESPQHIQMFYPTVFHYYSYTGEYNLAKPFLVKQAEMLKKNFNLTQITKNEEFLFMADSASGNYLSAIGHYQQFHKWKDSLFSVDRDKKMKELDIAYKTEKKDKDIKLLQQNSRLKDTTISNQATIRNITIGGIIVLLLLLIVTYSRYQIKQKSNKKLEAQREEINRQNDILRQLVNEKEWLLREIHHRVKNNLQIVISLLNTQSAYLENKDALLAIQNSQNRMHAMSLIHQKLYQTENLSSIDMSWYIHELVNYLKDSFDIASKIKYVLNTEPIELDVAQAVPLGLILNEAISNAIKYAFPNDAKGTINIELKEIETCKYMLRISDNGIGLSPGFETEERDSLGMNLMMGLTEQMDGSFNIASNNGVVVTINFIKRKADV